MRRSILLVRINAVLLSGLKALLRKLGWEPLEFECVADALPPSMGRGDAMILGLSGNAEGQLRELDQIHRKCPDLTVIALAEDSSEALAIAALRAGIRDYFKCPLPWEELEASLRRAFHEMTAPNDRSVPSQLCESIGLVGGSAGVVQVRQQIHRLAGIDSNVLITGETGTGKELVAQSIHELSARRHRPFISINCAAIPDTLLESELFGYERGAFTGAAQARPGKLEASSEGTVFFDEIGDMSSYAQAKILRALEKREVTRLGSALTMPLRCRFIAATNRELEREVARCQFRRDLFFRLNVTRIQVPALRERQEDIPALCRRFICEFNGQFAMQVMDISHELLEFFQEYEWPGNIRELKNLLEATFANSSSSTLTISDIPDFFRHTLGHVATSEDAERRRLLAALTSCKWNKSRAAAAMSCSRMTLYRKMLKYDIAFSGCNGARRM